MRVLAFFVNIFRFKRKNWRAIILSIFAATIFWFFNALNKEYTTNINFPLAFDYDRENFVPVSNLPQQVRVNVTGNGWDLFKRSTGVKVKPVEIPLERPAEVKKIVGSTLPVFFSNQTDGLEINFVLTDTLFLDLEPKKGRWLQVGLDSVAFHIRNGFGLASTVTVMPDSIYLEGPKRIIDRLEEPYPLRIRRRNIDDDFMEDVEIELPSSELIQRNPPTVAVMFNVERLVAVEDSVLIDVINVPETVKSVEKRYIPITLSVPENMVGELSLDSTRAVLDLKNFSKGAATLLPRIEGLPPFTSVIKIDSVNIML